MGILLPNEVDWSPANWVGRALFEDLLERGGLPQTLISELQFCVDADLDTLDLRAAPSEHLAALQPALADVIRRSELKGATSFQRPEFHPVYLEKLRLLATQLAASTPPSPTASPARSGIGNSSGE